MINITIKNVANKLSMPHALFVSLSLTVCECQMSICNETWHKQKNYLLWKGKCNELKSRETEWVIARNDWEWVSEWKIEKWMGLFSYYNTIRKLNCEQFYY